LPLATLFRACGAPERMEVQTLRLWERGGVAAALSLSVGKIITVRLWESGGVAAALSLSGRSEL
jgi:hypothetical protein